MFMQRTNTPKRVILAEGYAVPADEKQFEHIVATSVKPVLVDFWADWCGPCEMQAPILDEFAAKHASEMRVIKVEADKHPFLMERFNIRNIPTMIVFEEGKEAARMVGARPLDLLEKELSQFVVVETKEA